MLEEAGFGVEAESDLERVEDLVTHTGREEPTMRGPSPSGKWGTHEAAGGGRQDWAQVYSTVHVSPVWLRGWRRGPVGVTTEAGVCERREEGGGGVGGGGGEKIAGGERTET